MEDIEESNVSNDTSIAAPVLSSISSLVPLLSVGTNQISNFRKRQQDDDDFLDTEGNNEVLTSIPPIISVTAAKDEWNINETIVNVLKCDNIEYFTPVQRILIPKLLKINTKNGVMPRDFCVSAPTGSGKTLAYAIPIVQTLMTRSPTNIKLRALILLPSRELAAQVYRVICRLAKDTDLKIILASGQKSFEEEQKVLSGSFNYDKRLMNNYVDNFYTNKQYYTTDGTYESDTCDILVCTPGRFLDHIFHTNGFTLKYLRFIVLDEADRLLGNAYHDWVRLLVKSSGSSDLVNNNSTESPQISKSQAFDPLQYFTSLGSDLPPQRLLFSATLTDNPKKLSLIGIRNPLIIRAGISDIHYNKDGTEIEEDNSGESGFILPPTLSEGIKVCDAQSRPSILIAILVEAFGIQSLSGHSDDESINLNKYSHVVCGGKGDICLIFSSSVETTHRLAKLLHNFNNTKNKMLFPGRVAEMSRTLTSLQRDQLMKDTNNGEVSILVSSDNMARGIDVANIKLVINYDPPKYAKTYVHRVGRTARAGRSGHAITILKEGQVGTFKKMRLTINGGKPSNETERSNKKRKTSDKVIDTCKLHSKTIDNIDPLYKLALQRYKSSDENENHEALFQDN